MSKRSHRQVLVDLALHNDWMIGVELGVFKGETLFYLLERCPDLMMIGVDDWKRRPGPAQDKDTGWAPYDKPMEEHGVNVIRAARKYGGRCRIMEGDTAEAAELFEDSVFDFVFIDADHTTAAVTADIDAWQRKVRPNGMLLGHDADWPSVRRALLASFGDGNWQNLDGNVWAVKQ